MSMVELQVGDQTIRYDRQATAQIYATTTTGWAERCGCAGCRNYVVQRDEIYPPVFRELLDRLGIDPNKEAEVVLDGPLESGLCHYGGWFFFVGEMLKPSDTWESLPGKQVKMRRLTTRLRSAIHLILHFSSRVLALAQKNFAMSNHNLRSNS